MDARIRRPSLQRWPRLTMRPPTSMTTPPAIRQDNPDRLTGPRPPPTRCWQPRASVAEASVVVVDHRAGLMTHIIGGSGRARPTDQPAGRPRRFGDMCGNYQVVGSRLMTPCHGQYRRAGAAPVAGHGPQPSRAELSAAHGRSSRYPSVTGARMRWPGGRSPMYNASCQRRHMQSGDHLPGGRCLLRDNTLRAIRLYQKAHLGDPGCCHSSPSSA
jgi:hypothetical protein